MFIRLSFLIICLTFFSAAHCNCHPADSQRLSKVETIGALIAHAPEAILELRDDRLYLNLEKIVPTNKGLIALASDHLEIAIPELYSDAAGCFIPCTGEDLMQICQDDLRIWWCDTCRALRSMDKWGRCTRCGRKL
ncbi:MAG: hypothetical protein ACHQT8_01005 [Chlamydiales bacterium]